MIPKKELEKIPFEKTYGEGNDGHIGRAYFYKECLVVDIYAGYLTAPEGKQKPAEPAYRWATDKKSYASYICKTKKWGTNGIGSLVKGYRTTYLYGEDIVIDIESVQLVQQYCSKYKKEWRENTAIQLLLDMEEEIRDSIRARNEETRRLRIQKRVSQRKPLPKDWDRWVHTTVFRDSQYIFYRTRETEGFCTSCQKRVMVPKNRKHNASARCPECGKDITYKCEGRTKEMKVLRTAVYLQKTDEGFLTRYLSVCQRSYMGGITYGTTEEVLATYNGKKTWYDYHFLDGRGGFWEDNKKSAYNSFRGDGYLYTKNLKHVLEGTKFQYAPLGLFQKHEQKEIPFLRLMTKYERCPYIEYMVKMGLFKLTREYVEGYEIWSGSSPKEILGIDTQKIRELAEMDGGIRYLQILRIEQTRGGRLKPEEKQYIDQSSIRVKEFEYLTRFASVSKIKKYMYENLSYKNRKERESHWVDYVHMADGLGWDLENEIVLFPRNLVLRHDEAVVQSNKKELEERCRKADEKYTEIPKRKKQIEKKYGYKSSRFLVCIPESASEIILEGVNLKHCVGRDCYLEEHNNGTGIICFLRKTDAPDRAFYTLEIEGDKIQQWYGEGDKRPEESMVKGFLEEYEQAVLKRKRIRAAV